MSYVIFLEKHYGQEKLRQMTAAFLNIDTNSIGYLQEDTSNKNVYIEITNYEVGFRTQLAVYKDSKLCTNLMEIDFSLFLSKKLNDNALVSYWTNNPFLWILVKPNGDTFKAMETPKEDEGIEIDLKNIEALSLQLIMKEKNY